VGEACSSGPMGPVCLDPSTDSYCDSTQHCSAFLPAGYGERCGATDAGAAYVCTAYGTCNPLGTSVCIPPAADGELCDDRQGLSCLPPARCTANHCIFPTVAWCVSP
jgi:hypothetical protein